MKPLDIFSREPREPDDWLPALRETARKDKFGVLEDCPLCRRTAKLSYQSIYSAPCFNDDFVCPVRDFGTGCFKLTSNLDRLYRSRGAPAGDDSFRPSIALRALYVIRERRRQERWEKEKEGDL